MSEKLMAVEIKGLTKNYGRKRGVRDISLSVREGDMFGFLGPNGAGKSTVIRSMLGLLRFQEGSIRLLGLDAVSNQREIMKKVGYMPSEPFFYPDMKVRDVIRFAAEARGLDCREEARKICCLLAVEEEKRIRELSLGNRKKVSIVCALQHRPELLILDEPTSGLDPLMQEAFFQLLLEYNRQGTTCFLSSHVLSEVKKYCANAAVIREGRIIRTDSVEQLSRSRVRRVRIWKNGKEESFSYAEGMKELVHRLDEMQVDDVLIEEPPLEELFMDFYERAEEDGNDIIEA
ncbi:MAG: ABC transporter ATP-binding protein [Lachnospiraceae bacterium]|nr:ABC transporter ATP-binding protein [Lachnospiraceae bacterium]